MLCYLNVCRTIFKLLQCILQFLGELEISENNPGDIDSKRQFLLNKIKQLDDEKKLFDNFHVTLIVKNSIVFVATSKKSLYIKCIRNDLKNHSCRDLFHCSKTRVHFQCCIKSLFGR